MHTPEMWAKHMMLQHQQNGILLEIVNRMDSPTKPTRWERTKQWVSYRAYRIRIGLARLIAGEHWHEEY